VGAAPIVFLSDFGLQDEFVGTCHAVVARRAPAVRVIDLTHGIPRGDVLRGALTLAGALGYLPEDAVLLAVVDPGVGGSRRAVAIGSGTGRFLVGPDNGVLSVAWSILGDVAYAASITSPDVVLQPTSFTFHGRDVFAPAAAHLAGGGDLRLLGDAVDPATLVRIEAPRPTVAPGSLTAIVLAVDLFGNAQLGADAGHLAAAGVRGGTALAIRAGATTKTARRADTYGDGGEGELLLLVDSSGRLALACNGGDAAGELRVAPGDTIEIGDAGATASKA
jgi:S-adenosyl-L-methionine hydrolase (adenosine-forming)